MCSEPFENFTKAKMHHGVTLAMLIPDSLSIVEDKWGCTNTQMVEDNFGNSSNNLSKINTTITINTNSNLIPYILG